MPKSTVDTAWPRIDPGKMRHRISIQAPSATQDAFGQQQSVPGEDATVLSCFAAVDTMSTREQFQEGFVSQVIYQVLIRWPGANIPVNASQRIVLNGTNVLEIQAVENIRALNLVLRLTCLEIDQEKVGS